MVTRSKPIRTRSQLREYIATLAVPTRVPHTHNCPKCAALPDPINYEHDLCGKCLDEIDEDLAREAAIWPDDELDAWEP